MWHYHHADKQNGPVEEDVVKGLIQSGTLGADTMVWQDGMANWAPVKNTPLTKYLPGGAPLQAAGVPAMASGVPVVFTAKSFADLFKWWWITLLVGVLTVVIGIGFPILIASTVLGMILLYRFWTLIQDGYARTTPGKAVGFCFIPFFNFYWIFQAWLGLAKDTNAYCQRNSIAAPAINEKMALWTCILSLCGMIPYLGAIAGIASAILTIMLMKQFCDTAIAIVSRNG